MMIFASGSILPDDRNRCFDQVGVCLDRDISRLIQDLVALNTTLEVRHNEADEF